MSSKRALWVGLLVAGWLSSAVLGCRPEPLDERGLLCDATRLCTKPLECVDGRCAEPVSPSGDGGADAGTDGGTRVTLVAAGSTWRYSSSTPTSSFAAPGYDDSAWSTATAPLGFGMTGLTTEICCADAGIVTVYARRHFNADGPDAVRVGLRRDDGAVVYLNGVEVMRSNMPTGAVGPQTVASTHNSGADETTFFELSVDAGVVHAGDNVVAAEVHQDRPESSDLVFDLWLQTPP